MTDARADVALNPNDGFRFVLELAGIGALGYGGWAVGAGALRWLLALGLPLVAAPLSATFRVPNDPGPALLASSSRSSSLGRPSLHWRWRANRCWRASSRYSCSATTYWPVGGFGSCWVGDHRLVRGWKPERWVPAFEAFMRASRVQTVAFEGS